MAWSADRTEWLPSSLCSFGIEEVVIGALAAGAAAAPEAAVAAPAILAAGLPEVAALAPSIVAPLAGTAAAGTAAAGGGLLSTLGTIAPIAGTVAGAASTLAGTLTSAQAARQAAETQSQALIAKSAADRMQASQEAGVAQRLALNERRKTELVLSRSRAVAAAGGGSATDPSTLTLESNIAGQGEYNALSQLAAGRTKEAALNYQAEIDAQQAGRYLQAGGIGSQAALYSGLGTLASGLTSSRVLFPRLGTTTY